MKISKTITNKKSITHFKTLEEKFNLKHGGKYTYENSIYYGAHTPIGIECNVHGTFLQTPNEHLKGKGCSKCGAQKRSNSRKILLAEFVEKAKIKHKGCFDYSRVVYKGYQENISLTCNKHGAFTTTPALVLKTDNPCKACLLEHKSKIMYKSKEDFINKANKTHSHKYKYPDLPLTMRRQDTLIKIVCQEHGEFEQVASNHLAGNGCQKCSIENASWAKSRYTNKRACLYFIQFGECIYKVGITSQSIKRRFLMEPVYSIILEQWFFNGEHAYEIEREILKATKHLRYNGSFSLNKGGDSELRSSNIIEEIKKIIKEFK